jgi:hypothetical protein
MPKAGRVPGVQRATPLHVQPEFRDAVKVLAAHLNTTNGVIAELGILLLLEALPDSPDKQFAKFKIADVRQYAAGILSRLSPPAEPRGGNGTRPSTSLDP